MRNRTKSHHSAAVHRARWVPSQTLFSSDIPKQSRHRPLKNTSPVDHPFLSTLPVDHPLLPTLPGVPPICWNIYIGPYFVHQTTPLFGFTPSVGGDKLISSLQHAPNPANVDRQVAGSDHNGKVMPRTTDLTTLGRKPRTDRHLTNSYHA